MWDLLAGDRATLPFATLPPAERSGVTSAESTDPLRYAQPSAAAGEWEARASRVFANPELAGLRLSALGYALALDGKKQDAIPIWEQIVKQSPATDFLLRNILARLKGQPTHEIVPDSINANPFNSLARCKRSSACRSCAPL